MLSMTMIGRIDKLTNSDIEEVRRNLFGRVPRRTDVCFQSERVRMRSDDIILVTRD